MMESPINPAIPVMVVKSSIGALALISLFSVYHQRRSILAAVDAPFKELKDASDEEGKVRAINGIVARLRDDAMMKKGAAQLSTQRHGKELLKVAVLKEDGSNSESVSAAVKLLCRVFGQSNVGKKEMARLSGPQTLVKSLSVAHTKALQGPLEDIALTLREFSTFSEEKQILQYDVPEGAECAYALARMNGLVKMLSILDPATPKLFLSSVTTVLANVCCLDCGARNIARGCHGRSGISFFLRLLDHSDLQVVDASLKAISCLCRADFGHDEIVLKENVERLSSNFSPSSDRTIISSMLTIVLMMAKDDKHSTSFFKAMSETAMLRTMFDIWVGGNDAETRRRGELLACLCLQNPGSNLCAVQLLQAYRRPLEERAQKDKMEEQKKQQAMQERKFMEQMMMQQMGMEGMMGM